MAKKIGFLNFYLNGSDRETVKDFEGQEHFLVETLESLCIEGHKVAFSFKPQWGSWSVAVTTENKSTSNCKYILSDFGSTPENALARIWVFHSLICAGDDWDAHMTSIKEFDQ